MRAVSKALGAILTASALAGLSAVAAVAATTATATTYGEHRRRRRQPGGLHLQDRQLADVRQLSKGPYREPVIWGPYGGYVGMAGNWARVEGCKTGNFLAWSQTNSNQANTNYTKNNVGIGTGVYWYMGGPGVDPHWNGTTGEAAKWGAQQAADALAADAEPTRSPTR